MQPNLFTFINEYITEQTALNVKYAEKATKLLNFDDINNHLKNMASTFNSCKTK